MATEKVSICRKYHGKVPIDKHGQPLPKSQWPKKRLCRWAVRWFSSDGKRYSKSFKTRKEAERFAETKQLDVRNGKPDAPTIIYLRDFAKEHLMLIKGQISLGTLSEHKRALRYFLEMTGNLPLHKITAHHAELYVKMRSETGVSVSTVNKEIASLKRIFSLAGDRRGYLPEGQNCFKKIKKRKRSQKSIRYISLTEMDKILESAHTLKWKVFLSLIYTTGLRLGEASNLTWADIDFEREVLQVSAKRGSKSLVPWEPKDHELRHIPLCPEMMCLLVQWQSEAPECVPYVFLTAKRYDYVIELYKNGKWDDDKELINNVLRDFKVIRRRSGVENCTIHDFRRSYITNCARSLPAHVVRKLAGHSSLETTMKYYLAVEEYDLQNARYVGSNLFTTMASNEKQNLKCNPTDPLLTHFGQNGPKSADPKKAANHK